MATLVPPDPGHCSITVHGRTYSCAPGGTVSPPEFDAATMRANGWTDAVPSLSDMSGASSAAAQALSAATALEAALPAPSNAIPQGVGVGGAAGSGAAFARADHTHATSVQRAKGVTISDGTVTWSFANTYPAGKLPTCQATPEQPAGSAFFYVAQTVAGSISNTQVKFQVLKFGTQVLSALGVTLFGTAGAGITLHMQAALPTQ